MLILGLEQAFDLVFYYLGMYLSICTRFNLYYYWSCIFIEVRQDPVGINLVERQVYKPHLSVD
jgi:hypothetical protein